LILPLSAIFSVAGTGATQLSVLPAIASFLALISAWRLGSLLFSPVVGLAAAFVLAVLPMDVATAGILWPDMMQGALLALAVLCLLYAGDRHFGWAVFAGGLWAWAYYVKIDAAILIFVIGLLWLLKFVSFRVAVVAGFTAAGLVGIELVAYAVVAGKPFLRLALESTAANEVLAAGHDYRSLRTYPKAMFLVPYEAGLFYFFWVAAIVYALWTRSRPGLLLAGWSVIWLLWLMFGADPFSGFRLKPQLSRYLLAFSIPVAIIVSWTGVAIWRRSRTFGVAFPVAMLACIAILGPFNRLSYEATAANLRAFTVAVEKGWQPLCPDSQSFGMLHFLMYDRKEKTRLCLVQEHNFLTGVTQFHPPPELPAYILINGIYARRLQTRNLVRPIDPAQFGTKAEIVWQVDNPMPSSSYAMLRLLRTVSSVLPIEGLRRKIDETSQEVLTTGDATIWRVEGTPRSP